MNPKIKTLIAARAVALAPVAVDVLREHPEDEIYSACFRYVWLVTKRPKSFMQRFYPQGDLRIDIDCLAEAFWQSRHLLPGPQEMLDEEIAVVEHHNREVAVFLSKQRSSNVIALAR